MSRNSESASTATIVAAIITGIFACIAAIVSLGQPFINKYADLYFATSTPSIPLLSKQALPANHKIAFVRNEGNNNDIYIMDEDGTNRVSLTNGAFVDDYPIWSPDGKYIAFHSGRSGNFEIYVMTSTGENTTNITNSEFDDINPSWSPDSSQIVFSSFREGNLNLYISNLITGDVKQITDTSDRSEQYPDWSPDGQRLVFSETFGPTQASLVTMNINGRNRETIYDFGPNQLIITPAWSPDGNFIAFTKHEIAETSGVYKSADLYTVRFNGSSPVLLTQGNDPDWSPDGKRLIFWYWSAANGSDIFSINIDGSGLVNLTNTPDQSEKGPTYTSQ